MSRYRLVGAVAVSVLALLAAACGSGADVSDRVRANGPENSSTSAPPPSTTSPPPDANLTVWHQLGAQLELVYEVESYGDLNTMTKASDVVVVAQIERIDAGDIYETGAGAPNLAFINFYVRSEQVLRGKPIVETDGTFILEIPQPAEDRAGADSIATQMQSQFPTGRMLLFLRDKGTDPRVDASVREYGRYRLVVSYGLVVDNGGNAVMPLRLHTGGDPFADAVNAMPFDAVLDAVTASSAKG